MFLVDGCARELGVDEFLQVLDPDHSKYQQKHA
jgi:hypothetical protein